MELKQKLIDTLVENSVKKEYPELLEEWMDFTYEHVDGYDIACACGKKHIKRLFHFINTSSQNTVIIGSSCIKKMKNVINRQLFNRMIKEMNITENLMKTKKDLDESYITLKTTDYYFPVKKWDEESKQFTNDFVKNKYTICLATQRNTVKYYTHFSKLFDRNPIYKNKKDYMSIKVTCPYDMDDYLFKYQNNINIEKHVFKGHAWFKVIDPEGWFSQDDNTSDMSE